jgi:hypothetical protein
MKYKFLLSFSMLMITISYTNGQTSQQKITAPAAAEVSCDIRYYYFPNIQAYFDLKNTEYIYHDKGEWITAEELPHGYMGYSLNNKINVPIRDYNGDDIILQLEAHKKRYPPIRGKRIPAEYKLN